MLIPDEGDIRKHFLWFSEKKERRQVANQKMKKEPSGSGEGVVGSCGNPQCFTSHLTILIPSTVLKVQNFFNAWNSVDDNNKDLFLLFFLKKKREFSEDYAATITAGCCINNAC